MTYADVFRPTEISRARYYDFALVIFGSLLIALSARIVIPLPFSPVPITGQTLMVLLIGMVLGSRRGALTVLAYLSEGIVGLPVFAGGVGPAVLLGPTGGYLVGFVLAAFVVGLLAEQGWDRKVITTALAMLIGNALIYLFGVLWLANLIGLHGAFTGGLYPFLIGDVLKIGLAMILLPTCWKLIGLPSKTG